VNLPALLGPRFPDGTCKILLRFCLKSGTKSTCWAFCTVPERGSAPMSVDKYRRHAVDCLRIAEGLPDPLNRMQLIDMAQSWLLLAQQAEKPPAPHLGYGTAGPSEAPRTAVTQQQQQIQPKKEE
jgi:hypothetical protein